MAYLAARRAELAEQAAKIAASKAALTTKRTTTTTTTKTTTTTTTTKTTTTTTTTKATTKATRPLVKTTLDPWKSLLARGHFHKVQQEKAPTMRPPTTTQKVATTTKPLLTHARATFQLQHHIPVQPATAEPVEHLALTNQLNPKYYWNNFWSNHWNEYWNEYWRKRYSATPIVLKSVKRN